MRWIKVQIKSTYFRCWIKGWQNRLSMNNSSPPPLKLICKFFLLHPVTGRHTFPKLRSLLLLWILFKVMIVDLLIGKFAIFNKPVLATKCCLSLCEFLLVEHRAMCRTGMKSALAVCFTMNQHHNLSKKN